MMVLRLPRCRRRHCRDRRGSAVPPHSSAGDRCCKHHGAVGSEAGLRTPLCSSALSEAIWTFDRPTASLTPCEWRGASQRPRWHWPQLLLRQQPEPLQPRQRWWWRFCQHRDALM